MLEVSPTIAYLASNLKVKEIISGQDGKVLSFIKGQTNLQVVNNWNIQYRSMKAWDPPKSCFALAQRLFTVDREFINQASWHLVDMV